MSRKDKVVEDPLKMSQIKQKNEDDISTIPVD